MVIKFRDRGEHFEYDGIEIEETKKNKKTAVSKSTVMGKEKFHQSFIAKRIESYRQQIEDAIDEARLKTAGTNEHVDFEELPDIEYFKRV